MSSLSGAAGYAALAICESMLLSLTENKIIDQTEARSILADAAAAHRNSIPLVTDGGTVAHEEAASLIETMLKGGNSVRHA
jgi:predicted metal-dependent phosphotriesterase family hydrolase